MNKLLIGVVTLSVMGGDASVSRADLIPTLFNTGVNSLGKPLADGTVGDSHYTLVAVPTSTTSDIRVRTSVGGYPINGIPGFWLGDDTASAWVGPNNDSSVTGPQFGTWVYQTAFDLTGFDLATTSIAGRWAADDYGSIALNGNATGFAIASSYPGTTIAGYNTWFDFTINSGFVSGINTLEFTVINSGGGPTGLRVEFEQNGLPPFPPDGQVVPEPSTLKMSMILFGMFGVVWMRNRFKRTTAAA